MNDEEFNKWTTCKKDRYGFTIACKKHLWGVTAPTKEEAEREAKRYFVLYYNDGEYND